MSTPSNPRPAVRHATPCDVEALASLEAACFPAAEAAPRRAIASRVEHFPECFWLSEDQGRPVALVNGMPSSGRDLVDEMFEDAALAEQDGGWLMVFGVLTDPAYQHRGLASELLHAAIEEWRSRGRDGVVLTCKEHLLGWYGSFGFVDEGVSASDHGGATWYQMRLTF